LGAILVNNITKKKVAKTSFGTAEQTN
jgi:hypothetical protein